MLLSDLPSTDSGMSYSPVWHLTWHCFSTKNSFFSKWDMGGVWVFREFTGQSMFPSPWSSRSRTAVECPFKDSFRPPGWHRWQGWDTVFADTIYALNQDMQTMAPGWLPVYVNKVLMKHCLAHFLNIKTNKKQNKTNPKHILTAAFAPQWQLRALSRKYLL